MFFQRIVVLLAVASSVICAHPTENDTIHVHYRLKPVVKVATKVAGVQRDIASSVSLIDHVQLAAAPTHQIFEMIAYQVPGLYTTEWGMMGFGAAGSAAGKISSRGMGGGANTHVLILRDGRPDFMGLMGCTIADEFTSDGIERVEVIRGPGSFLYGTNATGGVINLVSKRMHMPGFRTQFNLGTGSHGSRQVGLSHGGKMRHFDYYLHFTRRETDGHREIGNAFYRGHQGSLHLGYQFSRRTQLEFNANLSDIRVNDPGKLSDPRESDRFDLLRFGGDLTLIHANRLGDMHLKLHGNFGDHDFFDGWDSSDRMLGVMAYQNLTLWSGNTSTYGVDYKRYGGKAIDASSDLGEIYMTEYAPYIHTKQLIAKRWIASAGLRLEHHALYGYETLPKAGLVFHASEKSSLRLSAAKGFRSPSIRELYFWMPANAELSPDRVWNYEAGLMQFIGSALKIELVGFQSQGSNLIQLAAPPPQWTNSGAYTQRGIEVIWSCHPISSLEFGGTWTDMDLHESAYNIPARKLTAHGAVNLRHLIVSMHLMSVMDWQGADFKGAKAILHLMKDYTVGHVSITAPIKYGIELKLTIRNLFNASYEAMYGYPMPGRTVMVDMGWRL